MAAALLKRRKRYNVPLMSGELLEFWDAVDQTTGWEDLRKADKKEKEAIDAAMAFDRLPGMSIEVASLCVSLESLRRKRFEQLLALDETWLAYKAFENENEIETEQRIRARLALFPPKALPSLAERNEAERQGP
ncbi:hypothetical protein JCM10213v2_000171 [Rhodosporidiobolus nylandii]